MNVWNIFKFRARKRAEKQGQYKVVGRSFFEEYWDLSDKEKKKLIREMLQGMSPKEAPKTNESDSEQRDDSGDTRL